MEQSFRLRNETVFFFQWLLISFYHAAAFVTKNNLPPSPVVPVTLAFRLKHTFISPSCEVLNRVFSGQTKLIVSSIRSVFVTCSWRKFRRPKNIIRKTGTSRNWGEYCCKRRMGYNSISVMWPFRPRWEDYCKLCICQVVRDKIVGEMVLKYDVTGAWSVCVCVCIYIYIYWWDYKNLSLLPSHCTFCLHWN